MLRVSRKSCCFSQHQLRLFVASKEGCSPSTSTFYVAVFPLVKYVDEGKCRRTAILAGIFCHARHEFGYQGRELDLCDGDGQHGDGATSVEPLVQPYNSVNFIELLPRFFALAQRSHLPSILYSGTFSSKWPDPTGPKVRNSEKDWIGEQFAPRFFVWQQPFILSFFLLFHPLLFSTSFLNRTSQWRSPALVTIKFHVFPFMKFLLSCRATLHDSPVCRLYYVFVLLYRPVPIYTKQYFSSSFFSPGNTIETIRATC